MINLTTNTKSFSVDKGTAGNGKSGGSGSTTKIIKQIINQGGGSSGSGGISGSVSYDVFTGATADNPGRQGLVPQPLAGQNTLFLKGNGIWDKVFQFIREDEEGNIYIDGKATKFGSPIYLKDIFSNQQDLAENLRKIEIHDNVKLDKDSEFVGNVTVDSSLGVSGDVSVGGQSDFLGESRFSNNVIFNRNQADGSGPNKVTVNADLEVNGKSNFTDDMAATNITVDYLTVTKLAQFFELVIDKIRASQGQIIITDANAKIDYVEKVDGVSRLYWRADSENQSNLSLNEFTAGDQIVCQTFNRGQIQKNEDGSYQGFNVSNKYYWVVCSGVGQGVEKTFPDQEGNPGQKHVYNFVEISDSNTVSPKDGTFLPEIGDEIVQLGNRRDTLRQAAIIISAYNNAYLDKGIKAPAIVQYDGINDFQLEKHRLNVISKGLNRFLGSYLTSDGKTDIVDKIGNIETSTNNKFSEIQQTIDGITQTVSNNKTFIETINSSINNIDSSLGNINSSLGNLSGKVETNTENISKLEQKADQIQATVTQNQNSIETINSSIGTLTGKVTENTTNISQLIQRADQISATVTQNTEMIEDVSTNLKGVIDQTKGNSDDIVSLIIQAGNINLKVEKNTEKIEKIGQDIGTANEKLESMQTTITNNKSEIDQRADQISATVSSHTEKIDNLTGKVTENTTNISKLEQKADQIQSTVTKIDGDYVTSSQLSQTSTEILAQVSNTYIKISDGRVIINAAVDEKTGEIRDDIDSIKKGNIELNGNTTINGNLTIQNATDGLTLVGEGGTTEIRSKNIGDFFDYIKNPLQYFEAVQTNGTDIQMYQDGSSNKEMFVNDNFDAKQTISIPANTQVLWDNTGYAFAAQNRYNMGFIPNVVHEDNNGQMRIKVQTPDGATTFIQFTVKEVQYIWTFTDDQTGAVVKSDTNVTKGSFNVGTKAIPKCRVRIQIYVKVDSWEVWKLRWSYNGKIYTLNNNSKVQAKDWVVPIPYTYFTLVSTNPEVNNLIGYNGQAFNFGGGDGLYIGQKGLQAKYGDYCFMINPKELVKTGAEGEAAQYYPKGIWEINKTTFTHATGPFNNLETATSEYITMGRSFGAYNVRHVTSSGNICVLPEDDIIVISQIFTSTNAKINVTVIFPPGNDGRFNGHIVKIVHIQRNDSDTTSSVTVKTSDDLYPIYDQDGKPWTYAKLNYSVRTFVQVGTPMMGHWILE